MKKSMLLVAGLFVFQGCATIEKKGRLAAAEAIGRYMDSQKDKFVTQPCQNMAQGWEVLKFALQDEVIKK